VDAIDHTQLTLIVTGRNAVGVGDRRVHVDGGVGVKMKMTGNEVGAAEDEVIKRVINLIVRALKAWYRNILELLGDQGEDARKVANDVELDGWPAVLVKEEIGDELREVSREVTRGGVVGRRVVKRAKFVPNVIEMAR